MKSSKTWLESLQRADRAVIAQLLSYVENTSDTKQAFLKELFPYTGKAELWGITGPPGAGKSTLLNGMITSLRKQSKRVGVLCVDPSSVFTGGALLGDRIRMQKHAEDSGVFIRSVATRGRYGGLSQTTREAAWVLDAAGFDVVLIETAGVGQTELEISTLVHTVAVVLVPESGDSIQMMKSGVFEIADFFVVNKADRPQADFFVKDLTQMLHFNGANQKQKKTIWDVCVLKTQAQKDEGVDLVVQMFLKHAQFLKQHPQVLLDRKKAILREVFLELFFQKVRKKWERFFQTEKGETFLEALLNRRASFDESFRYLKGISF